MSQQTNTGVATEEGLAISGVRATVSLDPVSFGQPQPARRFALGIKRTFDLGASIVAIIILAPVFLLIGLLIRLDSPGPAFFRAGRIGRWGDAFQIFKFRTMVDGAHEGQGRIWHLNDAGEGTFKVERDPRMTRVGVFLRSTSLDELPQLLNVVIGDMSLVGPRPLSDWEENLINGGRGRRLQIRPGITGAWQVSGMWRIPLRDRVQLEQNYLERWTFRGDLMILLKTLLHVLRRRGI